MIHIELNEQELKGIYIKMVEQRLTELEAETFFLDSKQLQKFTGMGWNSIVAYLLSDPKFPSLRLGNKWLFPRQEVEKYLQRYYEAVRDSGGEITNYRKRK
ncbi:MAG: helix-turn-helix domain-containing protein [Bacillota bacterium]